MVFLGIALDQKRPQLHHFGGFSDVYLRLRINHQPHEAAIVTLSHIKIPELGRDDDSDWVNVMHPEESSLPELHTQDYSPRSTRRL